ADGASQVTWTAPLPTGTYTITTTIGGETMTGLLRVQLPGALPRQFPFEPQRVYGIPEQLHPENYLEMTDRWRIAPPPYELDENSRGKGDPYNKNILKGDYPMHGSKDRFLVLTGISDTLIESRTLPTPSGVSTVRPGSIEFFGDGNQNVA